MRESTVTDVDFGVPRGERAVFSDQRVRVPRSEGGSVDAVFRDDSDPHHG